VNDTPTPPARLIDALHEAFVASDGIPASLQAVVRDYVQARRATGASIGIVLLDVKQLVRTYTGTDAAIYEPLVVGWAVRAYFEDAEVPSSSRG
jgi:hypothetical protein